MESRLPTSIDGTIDDDDDDDARVHNNKIGQTRGTQDKSKVTCANCDKNGYHLLYDPAPVMDTTARASCEALVVEQEGHVGNGYRPEEVFVRRWSAKEERVTWQRFRRQKC